MNILIPQLNKVKLVGYNPIFINTVEFDIKNNLYIILGGNGLGKTTILQSIIFGIAGPADENIEPQFKDRRWNKNYFKDRLDNPNNALIEISFGLGTHVVTIKRSVTSDKINEFILDGELITNDKQLTDEYFETFLQNDCGYNSIEDFYFVVHKLCYLSEKRENLAWDLDSQTRILMQILSNTNIENEFRKRRAQIKVLDSAMRHKTVAINGLEKRIQKSSDRRSELPAVNHPTSVPVSTDDKSFDQSQLDVLQNDLLTVNGQVIIKQREFNDLRFRHSSIVGEIEQLREELSKYEHAFFFEQLNKFESNEAKLAIYKLIHYKLCPACGTKSETLYQQAANFLKDDCCPLCGTNHIVESGTMHPGTEAELSEKLKIKIALEKSIIISENELNRLKEILGGLNLQINQHILNRKSTVVFIEKASDDSQTENDSIEKLQSAYQSLVSERNEIQIQFNKLQKELDDEYTDFNTTNNARIEKMFTYYEKYATEFLAIQCTLTPIESTDRFLSLKLFVPFFNNKIRTTPDSCSEAQRFFLDIAFRMALIDLISELGAYNGTFICETPENALDITYINNVSDMFEIFSWQNKNTLLLTSNIQVEGIAQNILSKVKGKKNKSASFLNLIEIGNLSKVQSSEHGLKLLNSQISKILKG
jgi:DNA repair exonuclease SbcCD ATPase subunit